MDRREALKCIAAEAAAGEIAFPTSAEVALRVQRALDDPDCHIEAAGRLVQTEPLLAARVVALANSVAFNRSGRAVTEVRIAVQRLGFRMIRALATAVVARQLAGVSANPRHRLLADQLWEHSAHVAALAHVLARRVTRQDPETAIFAGVVHEVGGFYLLSRAGDYPCLLLAEPPAPEATAANAGDDEDEGEEEANAEGNGRVGDAVLKKLSVPDKVVEAIEVLWRGYMAMPPASLGDTLLLADSLSPVRSPLREMIVKQEHGRQTDIDMVIGAGTLSGILKESADEVESMIVALRF